MSVFAGVSQLKQFEENSAVRIANPLRLKQRLVPRTTDSEPPPSPTLELKRSLSRASDRQFECDDDAVVACSEELRQRLLSVGDKRQRLETVDEDPVYMLEGPVSVRFDGISVTAVTTTGPPWAKQVEEKLIVKNVSGVLMPFRLTAIMGASGAGKSTLLNVLSRKLRSRVDGDVYYNQVRVSRSQALSCSRFVQQEDIFYPFITSSEHLEAQSKLRLPRQTKADQHTRAREVLDNFNLSKVADTRIGHAVEGKAGLSGGERKRLSVATEMISSPPLLFADEPTTGLDSSMAEVVIKKLKDLTLRGHCVACTIHQPSSTLFQKFDDLILMADGNVLYAGDTMGVVKWFKDKFGLVCPSTANPADFIIRVTGISDHVDRQVKVDQLEGWAETWRREGEAFLESWFAGDRDVFFDEMRQIYFTTAQLMGAGKKSMRLLEDRWLDLEDDAFGRRGSKPIEFVASEEITIKPETVTGNVRVASWWRQLGIMTSRCYKDVQRNPGVMLTKLIQAIIAAVLISMFIFQLTFNLVDSYTRVGVTQMLLIQQCMSNAMGLSSAFAKDQPVVLREHEEGVVRGGYFMLAKIMADWSTQLLIPILFNVIVFYTVRIDYPDDVLSMICSSLALTLAANAALSIGYMSSAVAPTMELAMALTVILIVPAMYFSGFMRDLSTMPAWMSWVQYVSVFKWGMIAYTTIVFDGNYVETPTGSIPGHAFLDTLGIRTDQFGLAIGVLIAMFVGFRVMGIVIYSLILRTKREAE